MSPFSSYCSHPVPSWFPRLITYSSYLLITSCLHLDFLVTCFPLSHCHLFSPYLPPYPSFSTGFACPDGPECPLASIFHRPSHAFLLLFLYYVGVLVVLSCWEVICEGHVLGIVRLQKPWPLWSIVELCTIQLFFSHVILILIHKCSSCGIILPVYGQTFSSDCK